jgi:hypothetical protein
MKENVFISLFPVIFFTNFSGLISNVVTGTSHFVLSYRCPWDESIVHKNTPIMSYTEFA